MAFADALDMVDFGVVVEADLVRAIFMVDKKRPVLVARALDLWI